MSLSDFTEAKPPRPSKVDRAIASAGTDRQVLESWLNDSTITQSEISRRCQLCAESEGRPELALSESSIRKWRIANGVSTNGAV